MPHECSVCRQTADLICDTCRLPLCHRHKVCRECDSDSTRALRQAGKRPIVRNQRPAKGFRAAWSRNGRLGKAPYKLAAG